MVDRSFESGGMITRRGLLFGTAGLATAGILAGCGFLGPDILSGPEKLAETERRESDMTREDRLMGELSKRALAVYETVDSEHKSSSTVNTGTLGSNGPFATSVSFGVLAPLDESLRSLQQPGLKSGYQVYLAYTGKEPDAMYLEKLTIDSEYQFIRQKYGTGDNAGQIIDTDSGSELVYQFSATRRRESSSWSYEIGTTGKDAWIYDDASLTATGNFFGNLEALVGQAETVLDDAQAGKAIRPQPKP